MNTDSPLHGKAVLVTGSTSGIGLGIARAFASQGARVMLHGLGDPEERDRLREEIAATTGAQVESDATDLRDKDAIPRLVERTEQALGSLDILVNNAGIQHVSPVEEFDPVKWSAIQDIVLNASFLTIRAAVPSMKRRGWGRIINLASAHGLVASPFKSAYVAAKHGLIGLTKTVALELAETGITCNAICPGYVRTPLVENQIEDQAKSHGLPRERVIREIMLAAQPTRRFVEVDEVAALAVFLSGDAARSITGTAIPIDGGWTSR
jgi:3-hydroxybutyrate dehydrogenase